MIQIKAVSDLRNKFPDIEKIVNEGEPVYLTQNGYGAMVDKTRLSHEEVFAKLRRRVNG